MKCIDCNGEGWMWRFSTPALPLLKFKDSPEPMTIVITKERMTCPRCHGTKKDPE